MLYSGVTGKITIKPTAGGTATEVLHASGFSVELSRDIQEVISFGNLYKEKVPGIKDWSASLDGSADFASASGQEALVDAFEAGTKVECAFYLNSTTFFTGDAYVESLSINHAADGKAEISISLAGDDAIELTVPSS